MKVSARFKPYPEYKDSGVEWLGKIPEEWEVTRNKNIFSYRKTKYNKQRYGGTASRGGGADSTLRPPKVAKKSQFQRRRRQNFEKNGGFDPKNDLFGKIRPKRVFGPILGQK